MNPNPNPKPRSFEELWRNTPAEAKKLPDAEGDKELIPLRVGVVWKPGVVALQVKGHLFAFSTGAARHIGIALVESALMAETIKGGEDANQN